jgi:hypothetical protein
VGDDTLSVIEFWPVSKEDEPDALGALVGGAVLIFPGASRRGRGRRRGAYGIRTRVTAVRGRRPRPLDECAVLVVLPAGGGGKLGEEDSNPRYRGQNPASYR